MIGFAKLCAAHTGYLVGISCSWICVAGSCGFLWCGERVFQPLAAYCSRHIDREGA